MSAVGQHIETLVGWEAGIDATLPGEGSSIIDQTISGPASNLAWPSFFQGLPTLSQVFQVLPEREIATVRFCPPCRTFGVSSTEVPGQPPAPSHRPSDAQVMRNSRPDHQYHPTWSHAAQPIRLAVAGHDPRCRERRRLCQSWHRYRGADPEPGLPFGHLAHQGTPDLTGWMLLARPPYPPASRPVACSLELGRRSGRERELMGVNGALNIGAYMRHDHGDCSVSRHRTRAFRNGARDRPTPRWDRPSRPGQSGPPEGLSTLDDGP